MNKVKYTEVARSLDALADKEKAKIYSWFFQTKKGQYGYGDIFLGITVPKQRVVAKKFRDISISELSKLIKSKVHEHRFVALEIAVMKFEKGDEKVKREIFDWYLDQTKYINNWDLVDTSASYIVGEYLFKKNRKILYKLAKSKSLWERRIAIISTHYFIRQNDFSDTLAISEMLLDDTHGLIQKATGWMLREVGKRSEGTLRKFLEKNHRKMSRTTLRYSIERFSGEFRRYFLQKK